MVMFLVRIARSLPLVALLAIVAIVVYFFFRYSSSPNRAKEVLIKLFTWIGIGLSAFFALACLYSLLEHNNTALDFMLGFLAVALLTLVIARICRAVFLRHNPKYRKKPTKAITEEKEKSRKPH